MSAIDADHRPLHFPGCHPEDAEDRRELPEGEQIKDTESCWHCGTPTTRGVCACDDCLYDDYIPSGAIYHCPTCRRWWAWMTGLNITSITFGAEIDGQDADADQEQP